MEKLMSKCPDLSLYLKKIFFKSTFMAAKIKLINTILIFQIISTMKRVSKYFDVSPKKTRSMNHASKVTIKNEISENIESKNVKTELLTDEKSILQQVIKKEVCDECISHSSNEELIDKKPSKFIKLKENISKIKNEPIKNNSNDKLEDSKNPKVLKSKRQVKIEYDELPEFKVDLFVFILIFN